MQFSTAIQITNLYSVIGLTETWLTKCLSSADILSLNHKICQKRLTIKKGSRQTWRNSHCSSRKCYSCELLSDLQDCVIAHFLTKTPLLVCSMYNPTQTQNFVENNICWCSSYPFFHKQRQEECKISELLIVSDINFDQTDCGDQ